MTSTRVRMSTTDKDGTSIVVEYIDGKVVDVLPDTRVVTKFAEGDRELFNYQPITPWALLKEGDLVVAEGKQFITRIYEGEGGWQMAELLSADEKITVTRLHELTAEEKS
jgi:hypothetical protein